MFGPLDGTRPALAAVLGDDGGGAMLGPLADGRAGALSGGADMDGPLPMEGDGRPEVATRAGSLSGRSTAASTGAARSGGGSGGGSGARSRGGSMAATGSATGASIPSGPDPS